TGLKIDEYLAGRDDIEVLDIDEAVRKDPEARLARMKAADISFLCLPDEESAEIAAVAPDSVRIIDASTKHRTNPAWVYGMPELTPESRAKIASSNRVALPGCHATGFILLVRPLIDAKAVSPEYPFVAHSITGYSGGGKTMIAAYKAYEENASETLLSAPRLYALSQNHKHLPEMQVMTGITEPPIFTPHVADYYCGMSVVVPLHRRLLTQGTSVTDLRKIIEDRYRQEALISVRPEGEDPESGYLSAMGKSGRNDLEIFILGGEDRILLIARFDNLGKGASGAGIQCMNLMLNIEEGKGLL
ncbi:MAG: N-acetyl-gamma-glutamyl-phosphate reductase, partial [Clostridiales Family XIII bacterium]|nr:N-acetyl-gamma-glutamyl-phosphate reductase [Clostridiales Family XIII bacterium]